MPSLFAAVEVGAQRARRPTHAPFTHREPDGRTRPPLGTPVHSLDLPAGSRVRLTATAQVGTGPRRWDVRLRTVGEDSSAPRLSFGSFIGERNLDQRIDIPPQDVDCRVEILSRHAAAGGWEDDSCTVQEDTPNEPQLAFREAAGPGLQDDLLLSFAIGAPDRSKTETDHG